MACQASLVIFLYAGLWTFSVAATFLVAALSGHLDRYPPYLGRLGDQPLESTMFTQFFVGVASVLVFVIHLRFVYASYYLKRGRAPEDTVALNALGMWFGHAAAAALFFLACFQESHAFYVHVFAFFLFLLGSTVYFFTQTVVSLSLKTEKIVTQIRFVLTGAMIALFGVFAVGYVTTLISSSAAGPQVLGAAAQWLLVLLFLAYFFTYEREFQQVMLTKTRIIVVPKEETTMSR